MNIFVLDFDIRACVEMHCDKHVVKMILEYAQLLSTAHHVLDEENAIPNIYKKTHVNHPSAVWARESSENYIWLYNLFKELCFEYTRRYNKTHLTQTKLLNILKQLPKNITVGKMTKFKLAMPDQYKSDDPIESYRAYYVNEKATIATWKYNEKPHWMP